MTIKVNITPNGRMSLPGGIRKRLGLTDGGAVYLDETAEVWCCAPRLRRSRARARRRSPNKSPAAI
jgi:bifunctional DNA-binding transcriptional regulator/antitoxin component of YhaV-PrlF toxin-antitoxin module